MIIKPNKELGQKAKYEDVEVSYFILTSKVTFTNKHKAVETKTLKEVRWITKNMMNLELVFSTLSLTQARAAQRSSRSKTVRWWPSGCSPCA
jgi:uncharacterized protein YejL (UPF0352 family)